MTYEEQLKDERWQIKRKRIIENYWGYCSKCGTSKNIHVHHTSYVSGLMAWEYPDDMLITLCADCHMLEHNLVPERQETQHIIKVIYQIVNSWRNG